MSSKIYHGDCLQIMATISAESVTSIVTDPPYGLSFMGKEWDHGVPGRAFWIEALRVAKPGAHLLAFGGTRTYHRLACAIEDAGWEIRDCVMWVYGSGFPKSHNLDGEWKGWGTALKPAWEPIIVARKPLVGTVAENVAQHGTGAINVDGCRVGTETWTRKGGDVSTPYGSERTWNTSGTPDIDRSATGRWPANLIHDGSDEVVGLFPQVNTQNPATRQNRKGMPSWSPSGTGRSRREAKSEVMYSDTDKTAARFFYCAKASKADRDEGCEGLSEKRYSMNQPCKEGTIAKYGLEEAKRRREEKCVCRNHHPTVKPTALMRYLCRLVTPQGGIVLDPFMGSGSTGKAAVMEGLNFIGIEQSKEYCEIAEARIASANKDGEALLFK